jgi:hypothetical protein
VLAREVESLHVVVVFFAGRWIKCYIKKIGACDVFQLEMWGLYLEK